MRVGGEEDNRGEDVYAERGRERDIYGKRTCWNIVIIHSSLSPSQNHIEECVYRAVTCPNKGCGMVLPYNQLESHEQTCPFRRVTCEHCNTELTISQLEVRKRGVQLMGNGD